MKKVDNTYKSLPFWSWDDELDEKGLCEQIDWMYQMGIGGFFMHARGGLKTEYLGEKWFSCIKACGERAKELGMEAYAYDENGWPSGFVGGKLLADEENRDMYLTHTTGAYDPAALVSYDLSGDALCRVTEGEDCLNVFAHVAASTADILNGEVVDKFIAETHERYAAQDDYGLKGFFTDEPQYYRAATPYTRVLAPYFKEKYGEDLLDGLGLLFVKKAGYRTFRYRFWRSMQELMLENFAKKIYEWCDARGYKFTGHYIEEMSLAGQMLCCGGIMPFYEYEHIPGFDWLHRRIKNELSAKQVASVAAQLGKKQVLTETFACCGWDVTPDELKWIAECQYVDGANLMCQHLLPFTAHGQRKRDYPAHFSSNNAWIEKGFLDFNNYFSVLGKLLADSTEQVNVAILHPIRSAYFDYNREDVGIYGEDPGAPEFEYIQQGFFGVIEQFSRNQVSHHYLDETLLAKYGDVDGASLVMGRCKYDYVVLPPIYTMDKSTEALLRRYVEAGGKILVWDKAPTHLEGEEFDYDYLVSNTSWEEILDEQLYRMPESAGLRSTYRVDEQGREFIYVVNLGEETETDIAISRGSSFLSYDILADTYTPVSTHLHFDAKQSYVLYLSDEEPKEQPALAPLRLGKEFTVVGEVENYLVMDMIRFSTDGVTYSEPWHYMGVFSEMLDRRYEGKLYLKYTATVDVLPSYAKLMLEDMNIARVTVNGKEVDKVGHLPDQKQMFLYDASGALAVGENEIVAEIDYRQGENVYYALFGEGVTESLRNCLAYDTDIEAAWLIGDFGVTGDFRPSQTRENVVIGENFRVVGQKKDVSCLVTDGYPFFAGHITLRQTVNVTDTASELIIDERYQLIDVTVNGKRAGRMMFGKRLDLSGLLHEGENELLITLTVSNRNLYGPHHATNEEPLIVGPGTWERTGTWHNGKSPLCLDTYAFVKTIL